MSASNNNKKSLKLDHLETEVLRKWAKAYGLKDDKDRKVLLEELVRYIFPHSTVDVFVVCIIN